MKKVKFIGIAVIAALGLSLTGCDNDKEDNNNTTLLLLAAKARMEAKARAVAVSGSVSGGLPAAVSSGGMTVAINKAIDQQKLMIAILNNGNDPVFAKEAVTGYIAAQRLEKASPKVKLASITYETGDPTTEVDGTKTFHFSGTIPSATVTVTTIPVGIFCNVNIYKKTGTTDAGYMDFGAGSTLAYKGTTGPSSSFTGSAELNSVVTYSNFGFVYPDYATIIWMIKSPSISGICKAANSLAKYAIIKSGSVTTNMIANYSAADTTESFTSQASFMVTLNSPDGIVIQPDGGTKEVLVTLENVVYDYNSDISVNDSNLDGALVAGSIDGSLSLTFSGIVNGISIDETIEVNL